MEGIMDQKKEVIAKYGVGVEKEYVVDTSK